MSRGTRITLLLVVAVLMALTVMGCASSQPTTEPAAESAAPTTGGEETPATGGEAATDAAALTEQKCSMCHPIDQVNSATYDAAGWDALITRMEQNGLVVTPEERQTILDYLSTRGAN